MKMVIYHLLPSLKIFSKNVSCIIINLFFSPCILTVFFLQQPLTFLLLMFFFRICANKIFEFTWRCCEKRAEIKRSGIENYNVTKIKWNIFATFCQAIVSFWTFAAHFDKIKNTLTVSFYLPSPRQKTVNDKCILAFGKFTETRKLFSESTLYI